MTEQFSDAGSIGTAGGFVDANQAYPHPSSLDPPLRSSVAGIAPEYKQYDSHEKAERYVSQKISDLRVMNSSYADKMRILLTDLFEEVVAFVHKYELWNDQVYAADKNVNGTGFHKKINLDEKVETTKPRRKFNPTTNDPSPQEEWIHVKQSVLGCGNCNWRSDSVRMFGVEGYWEHIRLATMFFAQHENPFLYNFGEESKRYQDHVLEDINQSPEVIAGTTPKIENWDFMPMLLAAKDSQRQPGILECAVSSALFDTCFVILVQTDARTKGNYTEVDANVVSAIRSGSFLSSVEPIPHYDHAIWKINSPGGRPGLYHFDPILEQFSPTGKTAGYQTPLAAMRQQMSKGTGKTKETQAHPYSAYFAPGITKPLHSAAAEQVQEQKGKPFVDMFGWPRTPATSTDKGALHLYRPKTAELQTPDPTPTTAIGKGKTSPPTSHSGSWEIPGTSTSPQSSEGIQSQIRQPMAKSLPIAKEGRKKGREFDEMVMTQGLNYKGPEENFNDILQTPISENDVDEENRIAYLQKMEAIFAREKNRRTQESLKLKRKAMGVEYDEEPVEPHPTHDYAAQPNEYTSDVDVNSPVRKLVSELFGDDEDDYEREYFGEPEYAEEREYTSQEWEEWHLSEDQRMMEEAGLSFYDYGVVDQAAAPAGSPAGAPTPSISDTVGAKASSKTGTPGPGGAPPPGGDPPRDPSGSKGKSRSSSGKQRGDPDPDDPGDPDVAVDSEPKKDSRNEYYAFYDEKPGAKIELTHKLTNFKQDFEVGKLRQLKKFITEVHLPDAMRTMPSRPPEIRAMYNHSLKQHYISVDHADARVSHVTFQAPSMKRVCQMQRNWRIKFLSALLEIFPGWVKDRLYDLCRNNGWYSVDRVSGAPLKKNVFEPEDEVHFLEESEFWCPEAVYYILLVSCYSGRGHERTAIQKYIAPPYKENESPQTIPYTQYKDNFKAWQDTAQMAHKFGIDLPDPVNIMKRYEKGFLGGDNKNGVLAQFQDLQHMWRDFRIEKNVCNYQAAKTHGNKVLEDISEFHHKVLAYIEHENPDHPVSQTPSTRSLSDGKKGKKGKGKEDKGKGKGKGKSDSKGKNDSKGKGKGKSSSKSKSGGEYTPEQWKEYCNYVCADGFRLGLCWDFVEFGACNKPRGECMFAKYGGHPGPTEINEQMKAAIQQRRARAQNRLAAKGQGRNAPRAPNAYGKGVANAQQFQYRVPSLIETPVFDPNAHLWATYYANLIQNPSPQLALPAPAPPTGGFAPPANPAGGYAPVEPTAPPTLAQQAVVLPTAPQVLPAPALFSPQTGPQLPATYTITKMHEDRILMNNRNATQAQRDAALSRMNAYVAQSRRNANQD